MAEPVLELAGVRKQYGDRVVTPVLHGIDWVVEPGELAALIGPSGSGKTTLLNLIGLLDRPSAGEIRITGTATGALDERGLTRFRGRTIGFIFQFHHLLPAFTALENVMLPAWSVARRASPELQRKAAELLNSVGLADQRTRKATDLSGGQQQRVAIARALINDPPLILADEPTGNLDTHTADSIFELLRRFNRERKSAIVVVTHDSRIASRCDRVVELVDGLIVSDRRRVPEA